jgi:large subunit ribosomal protein L18
MSKASELFERRQRRIRYRIRMLAAGRPRLSVFRSNKHIYAQVIDDKVGRTLASASTLETEFKDPAAEAGGAEQAQRVGRLVAERALKAGVKEVVFDRGGYRYHGRVKALADAAREAGLAF